MIIYTKYLKYINAIGLSFFVFIFIHPKIIDTRFILKRTIRHERIHLWQQVELLFVFQWIMYIFYYLRDRLRGMDHKRAYYNNPFEKEAYDNESDSEYLEKRELYNWVKYL